MTGRRAVAVGVVLVFAAVLISFLLYTRQMAGVVRRDGAVFVRLYALTFQASGARDRGQEERLTDEALFSVLEEMERLQIPAVLTDTLGQPMDFARLPFQADEDDPADLRRVRAYVRELDRRVPPLRLQGLNLVVHFGEPLFLRRLKWVPWLQAALLLAVVGGGAWLIRTSFRAERERIWSAMARESAHQMGTPLSSLVGWLERLDPAGLRKAVGTDLVGEMQADVERLQKVSRRFELIGRAPRLRPVSVSAIVERLRRYFSARLPSLGNSVRFDVRIPDGTPDVLGNETLLEWAFENLIKNALDALAGREGTIGVTYEGVHGGRAVFRAYDTGPGVPLKVRKSLFDIGVTTKEGGWGVGLSLTHRIVEEVHGGAIQLESTVEGASFRIELPVAETA
ncbi:MAG: PAS domain-containing sensor histidine kinase [Gemmatimonadota bacterium]